MPNPIVDPCRFTFGDTTPDGYQPIPCGSMDDLTGLSRLRDVGSFFEEHQFSRRSLHQIRDVLIACYNALAQGGGLRIAEPDWRNPSPSYRRIVESFAPRTKCDFHEMSELMMGAGLFVRGIEFHDSGGQFRIFSRDLECVATPARSRLRDERGKDPDIMYSSLVVDGYKALAGLSPAYEGWLPKFLAVGDSHTRFLAGKDDTEEGENIPHARRYTGFAAHFDALHLGPGLAYNLDRKGSKTRIFERINAIN